MPSADSRCVIISPCGLITLWFYRLRPCFVCPALLARLINDWSVQPFDAGDFFLPVFPYIPVAYNDSPFETQRTSRGKPRLLSAHDCQIYLAPPCDEYRTLSCVADSSRFHPASNLPALYPSGYGAYLYVNPRFCLRLPSGAHCWNTLALDYPSAPSAWIWTFQSICVKIPRITN